MVRVTGVPASTLRFYEEKGLIASAGRHGLRRTFEPRVVEQLALIALGRAAGLSLAEIARMFVAEHRPRIDRQLLSDKADELDRTIRRLTAMRDGLRHAVACRASSHLECPSFRRLMSAAAAGVRRKKPGRVRPDPPPAVARGSATRAGKRHVARR